MVEARESPPERFVRANAAAANSERRFVPRSLRRPTPEDETLRDRFFAGSVVRHNMAVHEQMQWYEDLRLLAWANDVKKADRGQLWREWVEPWE